MSSPIKSGQRTECTRSTFNNVSRYDFAFSAEPFVRFPFAFPLAAGVCCVGGRGCARQWYRFAATVTRMAMPTRIATVLSVRWRFVCCRGMRRSSRPLQNITTTTPTAAMR